MKPSTVVSKGSPNLCDVHRCHCVIAWTAREGTEDVICWGRSLGFSRGRCRHGRSGNRVCWGSLLASGSGTNRFVGPAKNSFRDRKRSLEGGRPCPGRPCCQPFGYVQDQVDQQSTENPTYGIVSPCTWCGKFTGNFCDGLLPTATQRGGACGFPVCTTCEAVLDTCRHCSLWKGLPSQVPDG